jgi:hypothetical protein
MDLVLRVRQALDTQPVDPGEFERCACALLRTRYPGLSAVEGGHDFGRDADIYFPFERGDTTSRGRLMVTTGDPIANMRTGLGRMRDEGLHADLVVMACTGPVNADLRQKLDNLCKKHGIDPPHIYAHDWFVAELVREPHWRKRLLGVDGALGALLDLPLDALENAESAPTLIGRDREVALLRDAVAAGKNIILIGVPGVGKTRLTMEMGEGTVFLETSPEGQLIDDLLLRAPTTVVVDDAHARLGELRILRRARHQEQLAFSIVATTWPDALADVREELPDATEIRVETLGPAEMDALVVSMGVTGHRARRTVLDQAAGRPGWALTLCNLFTTGHAVDVVSGSALWVRVERLLRRSTESEVAVDALACMAALGGASAEDLARIAPLVGLAPASVSSLMERLAHNGLVENRRGSDGTGQWRLQPALRSPLVARWFFTDPRSRPWQTMTATFPEREIDLTNAVVAAAEAGSALARREAGSWADSLPPATQWSAATIHTVARYSGLDEPAVRFAVAGARELVAFVQASFTDQNAVTAGAFHGALDILDRPVRMWLDPEAVFAMLDLALLDRRPRPNTPEHPLRVLSELAAHIDPDFGTMIEVRSRLLDSVLAWLRQDPSSGRWEAAAEVIAGIFSPEAMGSWIDPGDHNKFTLAQGIETPANLEQTIRLWPKVDSALTADRRSEAPASIPGAIVHLLGVAVEWLRIGCGRAPGSSPPTDEQQRLAMIGSQTIFDSLRPCLQDTPGLALRADQLLEGIYRFAEPMGDSRPERFTVDADLRTFVGGYRYWSVESATAELHEQNAAIDDLARRLVSMGAQAGAARFDELARQARIASGSPEIARVSAAMRPLLLDPQPWHEATSEPLLTEAALRQWLDVSPGTIPGAWSPRFSPARYTAGRSSWLHSDEVRWMRSPRLW